jgi:hypothetical protein
VSYVCLLAEIVNDKSSVSPSVKSPIVFALTHAAPFQYSQVCVVLVAPLLSSVITIASDSQKFHVYEPSHAPATGSCSTNKLSPS